MQNDWSTGGGNGFFGVSVWQTEQQTSEEPDQENNVIHTHSTAVLQPELALNERVWTQTLFKETTNSCVSSSLMVSAAGLEDLVLSSRKDTGWWRHMDLGAPEAEDTHYWLL